MPKLPISAQLYTVRDQIKTDFPGTVRQLGKIGYAGIELAGWGNLKTAADVTKACADAGVKITGAHVGIDQLEKDLNKALDESDSVGNRNIIIPWLNEDRRRSADDWRKFARTCNDVAAKVQARGFTLSYHNHSFEFQTFDGTTGYDIFLQQSDPKLVKLELDVYWLQHGNQDPAGTIRKLSNRVLLIHLKDMAAGAEKRFAPVGTGILDFKSILSASEQAGAKWAVVEQDQCYDTPPMEAMRISFENLKKLGAA
jgi:sugar phosphate isomerase/epimerase